MWVKLLPLQLKFEGRESQMNFLFGGVQLNWESFLINVEEINRFSINFSYRFRSRSHASYFTDCVIIVLGAL